MIALIFSFSAALCAALANFAFRKDTTNKSSSNFYLLFFYLCSLIFSFAIYPDVWKTPFNAISFGIGSCVGALNVALMLLTARALQSGPAGLTFAFQNASATFPGLLLFVLFGENFGFSYSHFQLIGILLVLFGLFVGTKNSSTSSSTAISGWLKFALTAFLVQVFALTLIQGRCILFECDSNILALKESDDAWFMPGIFGTAVCLQGILFFREKKVSLRSGIYGSIGGIANCATTFFLLLATKSALPAHKIILFPSFAVATIILCNIWANRFYKERFNFKTNALCTLGIFMGAFK